MRHFSLLILFVCALFARDYLHELKAYLTSKEFNVDGMMYSYDFNGNGYIEYNEWVYVSQKSGKKYRLLGTTPTEHNAFGFTEINVSLQNFSPDGYFSFINFPEDADKRFSWVYASTTTGKIHKLMGADKNNLFKYLQTPVGEVGLSDLTYQIDNLKISYIYKNMQSFPHIISSYDTPGFSWNVDVSEGYMAYVADGVGGVIALQIDGISLYDPQLFAQANIAPVLDVAIGGNRLFAAKNGKSIAVFDANSMHQMASISLQNVHDIVQLALSSDKRALYAVEGLHTLYIINLNNYPYTVSQEITGEISDIVVNGDRLYVVDSAKGIGIYSLENPLKPRLQTTIGTINLNSVAVSSDNGTIYASAYGSTKLLVMSANPKIMRPMKAIENRHEIEKIVIDDSRKRLYTLNTVASIDVYDISQKYVPKYLKTIYMPYPAMDMQVSSDGKLGFIASGGDGFKIINLSN